MLSSSISSSAIRTASILAKGVIHLPAATGQAQADSEDGPRPLTGGVRHILHHHEADHFLRAVEVAEGFFGLAIDAATVRRLPNTEPWADKARKADPLST